MQLTEWGKVVCLFVLALLVGGLLIITGIELGYLIVCIAVFILMWVVGCFDFNNGDDIDY